jgi:YVTN family beta-propeller protein
MNLRARKGTFVRTLNVESLEQRRLCVASLGVQSAINGSDADTAPGLTLSLGDSVALTYQVSNSGDVPLSNITLVDDLGTPSLGDDLVPSPVLTSQPARGTLHATFAGLNASKFVVHPTLPYLYASVPATNSIAIIDTNTLSLIDNVFVGSGPYALAVSNDGSRVYASMLSSFAISVLDTATNTALPPIQIGSTSYGIAVGADERLYVITTNAIRQIDPLTGLSAGPNLSPITSINAGAIVVSPDKTRLYYGNEARSPSSFSQFDLTTNPPTKIYQSPLGGPSSDGNDIAISSDGSFITYVGVVGPTGYSLPKFRTSDMSLLGAFNTGAYPRELAYSPDDAVAYTVNATGKIRTWNATTFLEQGEITVAGGEAVELQVDRSGRYVFASVDGTTDSIRVYNTGRMGVHNVGDINANQKLDPGESWSFQAATTAKAGANLHLATASAKAPDNSSVTDSDPSHYLVRTGWEAEAATAENVSGGIIGPIPSDPWTGGWISSDGRFEVVSGSLRLKAGQHLTAAADDGVVVELSTAEATPRPLGKFTIEVRPNPTPWTRPGDARDISGDGEIVALDALTVINYLILIGAGPLPIRAAGDERFVDVNGDGEVGPIDALMIINYLVMNNQFARPIAESGEGETAIADGVGGQAILLQSDELDIQSTPLTAKGMVNLPLADERPSAIAADRLFTLPKGAYFDPADLKTRRRLSNIDSLLPLLTGAAEPQSE